MEPSEAGDPLSVGVGVIREDFTEEVAPVNEDAGERREMKREPEGKDRAPV